jgi:hypothetical protein
MPPEDGEWSNAEMVRALTRIEGKLDGMAAGFVPRELHDQQIAEVKAQHKDLATWTTDIAASLERTARDLVSAEQKSADGQAEIRESMVTRKSIVIGFTLTFSGMSAIAAFAVLILTHA